jgi:hypothetical protein
MNDSATPQDEEWTTERPLLPKQEARSNWDMDRIVTMDMEAHDWDRPVAWELLRPDGTKQQWTREVRGETDPTKFVVDEILHHRNRNHTFVAHNGGGYDFQPLVFELIDRDDARLKTVLNDSTGDIFYVEIEDEHGKPRRLQDSMKIMPRGLADLASDMADVDKLEPELFDVTEIPPVLSDMDDNARDELLEYLHYDCLALRQCLESFTQIIDDISGGRVGPQLTVGSTTMAMYRVAFMDDEPDAPPIYRAPERGEQKIREAYYGGRTEVFRLYAPESDGPYWKYDVNSLYPYVYTHRPVPAGRLTHIPPEDREKIPDRLHSEKFGGVVKIDAHVPTDTEIPVLPTRSDATPGGGASKVVFPVGGIQGWYSVAEVEYAHSVGALENIEYQEAYLANRHYPFEQYGSTLYDMKQSIDKSENPDKYKVVKFLLNSFYGKFGMNRSHEQVIELAPEDRSDPDKLHGLTQFGRLNDGTTVSERTGLFLDDDTADAAYIRPRIATSITAWARIEMHKWIRHARKKGGRIYYCDTDSIFTDVPLEGEYLGVGDELGQMDLEEQAAQAAFVAPKTYAEADQNGSLIAAKAKGLKDPDFQWEDYKVAVQENNTDRLQTEWDSVRGAMPSLKQNEGLTRVNHERGVKRLDTKRDHDTRNPSLLSKPWHIEKREYQQDRQNALKTQFQRGRRFIKKGWRRVMSGQRDTYAQTDSTLKANEQKKEERKRRIEKGRDRDMFE